MVLSLKNIYLDIDIGFGGETADYKFTEVISNWRVRDARACSFACAFEHYFHFSIYFIAGFVSVSGEFTQSRSYQNAKQNMKKGGTVNIDIIGRATVYKARLHTLGDSLKVTPVLQKAIINLPTSCTNDIDKSKYFRLIQNFGTHYTSVVTMGAKAVQRLSMGTAGMAVRLGLF